MECQGVACQAQKNLNPSLDEVQRGLCNARSIVITKKSDAKGYDWGYIVANSVCIPR